MTQTGGPMRGRSRARKWIGRIAVVLTITSASLGIVLWWESGCPPEERSVTRLIGKVGDRVGRLWDRGWHVIHQRSGGATADEAGVVFLHHSCGDQWLQSGLYGALLSREYVDAVASITCGTDVAADEGRPDGLRTDEQPPGDFADMNHWLRWFNDHLDAVLTHQRDAGRHRIVLFKSRCAASNVGADAGQEDPDARSADPFSETRSTSSYQAVYRHPDGPDATYERDGVPYRPLEQVFARNPDTLFVAITAPPRHYGPEDATTDGEARRARRFNDWLKGAWLDGYRAAHPGLHNVAVFDWFDVLAYRDDHPEHPNRLRFDFGGADGDSHPNRWADQVSVERFVKGPGAFLDQAWAAFAGADRPVAQPSPVPRLARPAAPLR